MAKKTSEFLKGMGKAFGFMKAIANAVLDIGGDDSDMERVLKDADLRKQIAALIVGTVTKFAIADHFKLSNITIKFLYIGDNFKSWFYGKTEEAKDVAVSSPHHDLSKVSLDCEILNDLGGEAKAEVTMAGVYKLVNCQPNGEPGVLLTNGYTNIFYVRDVSGVLRAVYVHRYGDGWDVHANSVEDPDRWSAGSRVFSR